MSRALLSRRLVGHCKHCRVFVRYVLRGLPLLGRSGVILDDFWPSLLAALVLARLCLFSVLLDLVSLLVPRAAPSRLQRSYVSAHCLMPPDDDGVRAVAGLGAQTRSTYTPFFFSNVVVLPVTPCVITPCCLPNHTWCPAAVSLDTAIRGLSTVVTWKLIDNFDPLGQRPDQLFPHVGGAPAVSADVLGTRSRPLRVGLGLNALEVLRAAHALSGTRILDALVALPSLDRLGAHGVQPRLGTDQATQRDPLFELVVVAPEVAHVPVFSF